MCVLSMHACTLDVLDKNKQFKNLYNIMDNVPIHKHENIPRCVVNRGYNCVCLPLYSPELNPIEQF